MRRIRKALFGENVDIYLSLALALGIGILGFFDAVDESVVMAAILATLGVMSASLLSSRERSRAVLESVHTLSDLVRAQASGEVSMDKLLPASDSGSNVPLGQARDVGIVGVTLSRTIRNVYPELDRALRNGARVRVALIDPHSTAPEEAARRCSVPRQPEIFRRRLEPTLDLLTKLSRESNGGLEVRLLSYTPSVGLILVDPQEVSGIIHADIYAHQPIGAEPVLRLRADRDPMWFAHFSAEFERIWASGQPADLTGM